MSWIKYKIPQEELVKPEKIPPFDIRRLNEKGFLSKILGWIPSIIFSHPRWWLKLLRNYFPIVRFGRFVMLTRADDIQEALTNPNIFAVPFGSDMRGVSGGDFILGMDNGPMYRAQKSLILRAFPPDKMREEINRHCSKRLSKTMPIIGSEFDVVQDVVIKTGVELCEDYFGLQISNHQRFYESSIAASSFVFADISGSDTLKELAVPAADYLLKVIDQSIDKAKKGETDVETPLSRLVAEHLADPDKAPLQDIRSIMVGMIMGFLPTSVLGIGNALKVVLDKEEALNHLQNAIKNNDDEALDLVILEAMRFNPIQLGPFRLMSRDYTIAKGCSREYTIKKNSLVIPSTLSAMFDKDRVDNPDEFDPTRQARNSMVFGYGLHTCIGAPVARAFAVQVFKAVFALPNICKVRKSKGKMKYLGIFPNSQIMKCEGGEVHGDIEQSMGFVALPIKDSHNNSDKLQKLESAIADLGNLSDDKAEGSIGNALLNSQTIHMASAFICPAEQSVDDSKAHLIIEFNADGNIYKASKVLAKALEKKLGSLIKEACDIKSDEDLESAFNKHAMNSVGPLNLQFGLNFKGTPGHSVNRIRKENELSEAITAYLKTEPQKKTLNSLEQLNNVREYLSSKEEHRWAFAKVRNRLSEKELGMGIFLKDYFLSPWSAIPILIFIAFVFLNFEILGGKKETFWLNFWHVGAAISMTVIGGALIIAGLFTGIVYYLRKLEKQDSSQFSVPSQSKFDAVTAKENQILQNHMSSVSVIKASSLRMVLLRSVLWWTNVSVNYKNKPGEVNVINSIHFARWVRLPNTRQLLFISNYGGSWESYLEDFITKGSEGLSSIWSNTAGFPRTQYLFRKGAKLSEPFKNWARDQQVPTLFWFVAYPNLTTHVIRKNALIRQGISHINDTRDAEKWLSMFGSAQRPKEAIDTENIQSLMFSAMAKKQPDCRFLALSFDADTKSLDIEKIKKAVFPHISFGDRPKTGLVLQVAFSYQGLAKFGVKESAKFANVFRQGMVSPTRSRLLGDCDDNGPENWHWGGENTHIDLVVLAYYDGESNDDAKAMTKIIRSINAAGADIVHDQKTHFKKTGEQFVEHFGFADGLSQPIIKGTAKSYQSQNEDHLIAPGEFICGYPDERGNVSPAPLVHSEDDPENLLPLPLDREDARNFKEFGFNGSFLVVRQLKQDVTAFNELCQSEADRLREKHNDDQITHEWIGAKMIGRWKDGRPLTTSPHSSSTGGLSNDFRYRKEDPQALSCPFGSHIRRANPRDMLGEDIETQIKLANRHRILRRGRLYKSKKGGEVGLMFMCINADIERQFEFIQQTWMRNPTFGSLQKEVDPLLASSCQNTGGYSIPTNNGNVFVEGKKPLISTKGGGYFFLPGRQAIRYIESLTAKFD